MAISVHILKYVSNIYNFCFYSQGTFINNFNFNIVLRIILYTYLPVTT